KRLFDKALETYDKGLNLDPDNFEIYIDKGITYNAVGNHEKAIENFKIAAKLNPDKQFLNTNIAFEYLQLHNYVESIKYCTEQLTRYPEDELAFFCRGTGYFNLGKNSEAINDLSNATRINPSNANAWYNLSMAQNKLSLYKDALVSVTNAQKNGFNVADSYIKELALKAQ